MKVIVLSLLISVSSFAASSGLITVEGTLVRYDDKKVEIDTGAQKVFVPRDAFKSLEGYIAGKAHLSAKVQLTQFVKLNTGKN